MKYTTTLTAKAQITIPKSVRERIGLKKGTKIDIFPTFDGGFIGRPKRASKILEYAGDLAHLDDGRPLEDIRREAQEAAGREIANRLKAK